MATVNFFLILRFINSLNVTAKPFYYRRKK